MQRRISKQIMVGGVAIGGGADISIQSMTNTDTADYCATLAQINALINAGCDIVRVAVENEQQSRVFARLVAAVSVPLVADIQYDYKLAVACCDAGAAKVRINPGNIGSNDRVKAVADAARANGCAIRTGANSGSMNKQAVEKYGYTARALAESALEQALLIEGCGFDDIVLSAKASDLVMTVEANRMIASACGYPLHLGITESGGEIDGLVKSAAGLGALLADGIGDTLRVSLTADPIKEIAAARQILGAFGLVRNAVSVVSCPTCARCKYDMLALAERVRARVQGAVVEGGAKIAVMGCAVNGIGEARDAALGIAGGGADRCVVFADGKQILTADFESGVEHFLGMLDRLIGKQGG